MLIDRYVKHQILTCRSLEDLPCSSSLGFCFLCTRNCLKLLYVFLADLVTNLLVLVTVCMSSNLCNVEIIEMQH